MQRDHLIRFGAVCSATGGLALAVGWTLNIGRDSLPGAVVVLAGYVLALFAFMAIYGVQRRRVGLAGFVGFVFVTVACALFTPWLFFDVARLSGVSPEMDWRAAETNGPTLVVGVIGAVSFVVGFILLGVTTIRARILGRWAPTLLIVAGVAPLVYDWIPIGKLLPRIGGVALVLFAFDLWRVSRREPEPTG